jgi:hypothetical protein
VSCSAIARASGAYFRDDVGAEPSRPRRPLGNQANLAEVGDIPDGARRRFLQLRGPTTARIVDNSFYLNRGIDAGRQRRWGGSMSP